jgi:type I restriction enzyme S subunit
LAAVPAQLAQARQSLLAAAFRGELTADWREENQGYSAEIEMKTYLAHRFNRWIKTHPNRSPKNYKEPSLPALSTFDGRPNTWLLASPEQVASAEKYSLGIGPFGSDLKVSDYQDTGTPLIFVRDVKSGRFGGASSKYISPEKAADLQAHRVTAGDLLVTKMGEPPGDTSVYPENRPDGIITADCIRLRAEASITSGAYLCQALRSDFVRRQIDEISVGVAQQKVSLGRFATIGIPLPPLAEQHEIVRRLSAAFARLDAVARTQADAVATIDRLDQSLLARAFSGQLVPQAEE